MPDDTRRTQSPSRRGLIKIGTVFVLAVCIALVALTARPISNSTTTDNPVKNTDALKALGQAITGNPVLREKGSRIDFGYLGTMGNPPSQLSQLWMRSSQPTFQFDPAANLGFGWMGPYVSGVIVGGMLHLDKDTFGRPFIYRTAAFTRPSDGETVAIRIQSAGADGVANTTDDEIEDILAGEIYATVTGKVLKGAIPAAGLPVILHLPAQGLQCERKTQTGSGGIFTFKDVPFGRRSLTVEALGGGGQRSRPLPVLVDRPNTVIADIQIAQ